MDPRDSVNTTFVTRRRIFRFKVMPFGLCNTPSAVKRLMNVAIAGLDPEICLAYLDDIIFHCRDLDSQPRKVATVQTAEPGWTKTEGPQVQPAAAGGCLPRTLGERRRVVHEFSEGGGDARVANAGLSEMFARSSACVRITGSSCRNSPRSRRRSIP